MREETRELKEIEFSDLIIVSSTTVHAKIPS
jgi:hypothetical protein